MIDLSGVKFLAALEITIQALIGSLTAQANHYASLCPILS